MAIDLKKIFPIQDIEGKYLVAGNGDITAGWEVHLPEVFTQSVDHYNQLHQDLVGALVKLPAGAVIQLLNFFYSTDYDRPLRSPNFCTAENERALLGRAVLHHSCRMFITFPNGRLARITAESNPAVKLFDYLSRRPFRDLEGAVRRAQSHEKSLGAALENSSEVDFVRMDDRMLRQCLWEFWSMAFDRPGQTDPGPIPPYRVEQGYLQIGGTFVGVVSMVNQGDQVFNVKRPTAQSPAGLSPQLVMEQDFGLSLSATYPLGLGLPVNHILNVTLTLQEREKVYYQLWKRSLAEGIFAGFGYDPSVQKVQAIKDFKQAVSQRDYTLCRAGVNLIVADSDLGRLQHNLRQAATSIDHVNGSQPWIENFEALALLVGSSPGYGRGNYRTFDTVVEHALCYAPLETHYRSDPTGHVFNDRFGKPVVVDLWDAPYIQNRNGIVEGGSGTGKSFWINGLVDGDLGHGTHVMILDVGHSYRDLCQFNGGIYLDSSKMEDFCFNIFLVERDGQGQWCPSGDKKIFIHSVLMAMWRGSQEVSLEAQSILKDLVDTFYLHLNEQRITPSFEAFYGYIDDYAAQYGDSSRGRFFDFDSLRLVFKNYVTGDYRYLLSSPRPVDLSDYPLVVFDIESLESDKFVFPVVGLIIMEMVMDKVRKRRGLRKRFIIDEGWKVLDGELSDFVAYLYRTFRKHEGSILLATQDIRDVGHLETAAAILSNSDTVVLTPRATRKNYDDLRRWLTLTDHEVNLVEDLKRRPNYSEFFLKQGDRARIFRHEVSEKTRAVYSSKGKEKEEIQGLFAKYGNLKQAVNQYVENKNSDVHQ